MTTLTREDIVWLAVPRLLGFAFNWGLIGALSVQVYVYYTTFKNDRSFFKTLVYIVFLLDWAQTISATYDASQWFAFGWGDLEALDNLHSEFLNVPILTSVIGAIVQVFFGWRIWTLSKSKVVFAFIITMALLQLAGGAAVGYYLNIKPRETNDMPGLPKAVGVRLGTSAAVDIVIASCMTFYLLRNRSEFAFQTNAVVTKLVRLTVETGVITAAAAIVDLIFFLSMHNNALHQISGVNLAKLYTNSLMMLFNNRSKLKNNFGSSIEDTEIRLESTGQGRMRELESDGTGATVFHATTVKSNFSDV